MASIRILGKDVKVEFKRGKGAAAAPNEAALMVGANAMAALINSKVWPAELSVAFSELKKILFFNGKIKVGKFEIERPGVDVRKATFMWEIVEFDGNDPDGQANTLFHDCWHIVQFKRAGKKDAVTIDDQVAREVDATNQQIKAAKILGSAPSDIAFLEDFRDHPEKIKARLLEGVG